MAPDLVSSSRIPRAPVRPGGGHARAPLCFSVGLALLFAVRMQLLFDAGASPLVHLAMGLQGGGRKAKRTNPKEGAKASQSMKLGAVVDMESVKMAAHCWRLAAEVQLTCHDLGTSFDANVKREAESDNVQNLSKAMSIKEKVARAKKAAKVVMRRMEPVASMELLGKMQKAIDNATEQLGETGAKAKAKLREQFPARVWDWWLSQTGDRLWGKLLLLRAGVRCLGARKQLRQSTYQGRDVSCEDWLYGPRAAARRRTSRDDAAKLKAQIDHDYAVGQFTDDGLVELVTTAYEASKEFDQEYKHKVLSNRHLFKNLDAAPGAAGGSVPPAQACGATQQGAGATAWGAFSPTEEDEETSDGGSSCSCTASSDEQGGRPSDSGAGPRGGGGHRGERRGRRARKAKQHRERLLEKAKALAAEANERDLEALLDQLSKKADKEYGEALDQALQRPELVPASVTATPQRPGEARGAAQMATAGSDACLSHDIKSPSVAIAAVSRKIQQIRMSQTKRSSKGAGTPMGSSSKDQRQLSGLLLDVFIASLGTLCRDVFDGLPYFRALRMFMIKAYFSGQFSLSDHKNLLNVLCPGPQFERLKIGYVSSYEKEVQWKIEIDGRVFVTSILEMEKRYENHFDTSKGLGFIQQLPKNGPFGAFITEDTRARLQREAEQADNFLQEHTDQLSALLLATEYARRTRGTMYLWGIEAAKKLKTHLYVSEVESCPTNFVLEQFRELGLVFSDCAEYQELRNRWAHLLDAIIENWQQELSKVHALAPVRQDRLPLPRQARERAGILKELDRLVAEDYGKGMPFSARIDHLRKKVIGEGGEMNFGHFFDGEGEQVALTETTKRDLVWLKKRWKRWLSEKENTKLTGEFATQGTFDKVVRQIQADIIFAGEPQEGREPPELAQLGNDQKAWTARRSSFEQVVLNRLAKEFSDE
ncbi:unnamed protein product [Amoebophrya sp. A120]|nr:unnamed protein product [Amoebophrya sp. A120]|eukprot:GSA120T00021904001.1